jgi:hypothetical protein
VGVAAQPGPPHASFLAAGAGLHAQVLVATPPLTRKCCSNSKLTTLLCTQAHHLGRSSCSAPRWEGEQRRHVCRAVKHISPDVSRGPPDAIACVTQLQWAAVAHPQALVVSIRLSPTSHTCCNVSTSTLPSCTQLS